MPDEKFDCIIVGAGPAGVAAAITLGRAGLSTVVLERGEYPGAKNVQGAVLYTKMLADIVPDFWKEAGAPLERHITEQRMWLVAKDAAMQAGFRSDKWQNEPHNCYTIIRANFDRWFAKKAEEAGAQVYTGITVREGIKKDGKVVGVKTSEGDELLADVVIAADGVNSMLGQQVGLLDEWKSDEVALGVKEILGIPQGKLEDRFCLEKGEGTTIELFGDITQGMLGYAFLYTNKESISFGVGCKLSHFQKTRIRPADLLEYAKGHPMVRKLLKDTTPLEYSAHLIPEGGYNSMPTLFTDGFLIAGDAAQMVNPSHREGSNLAMAAGRLAAETVIEAKKAGDFSAKTLGQYQKRLQESFILPDLYDHRNLELLAEEHMSMFEAGPEMMAQAAYDYFNVDGRPKRDVYRGIIRQMVRNPAVKGLVRSQMSLGNGWRMLKMGLKAGLEIRRMAREE